VVLHPDSTIMMYSRWQIGTVAEVLSPDSLLVDMPDGARRHLYANKLRLCTARAQSVLLHRDKEFGRVLALPMVNSDSLPSKRKNQTAISHLANDQHVELLKILDAFPE